MLKEKYIDSTELFPDWFLAKSFLIDLINGINDVWKINWDKDKNSIDISLDFLLLGTFPVEYQEKIKNICFQVVRERLPDLSIYLKCAFSNILYRMIESDIEIKERDIIACGGRNLKEEFAFKLGVYLEFKLRENI